MKHPSDQPTIKCSFTLEKVKTKSEDNGFLFYGVCINNVDSTFSNYALLATSDLHETKVLLKILEKKVLLKILENLYMASGVSVIVWSSLSPSGKISSEERDDCWLRGFTSSNLI